MIKLIARKLFSAVLDAVSPTVLKPQPPTVVVHPPTPTPPAVKKLITIAIMNRSTILTDEQVAPVVSALQIQVSRDFAPVWLVDADLVFVGKNAQPPAGTWQIALLDDSDQPGALGYHDLTPDGFPLAKVFAKTDKNYGSNWTVTLSHELLETLGDPDINLCTFDSSNRLLAMELCDAPEADQFGYLINGVLVSDFVYPAWFGVRSKVAKYDHMGYIKAPGELLAGGYISVYDFTTGWTQTTAQKMGLHPHRENAHKREGSRRGRRAKKGVPTPITQHLVTPSSSSTSKKS